jgi:hypothetical protein
MSVHHSSLGRAAVKARFTMSAGVLTASIGWPRRLRLGRPNSPRSAMIEAPRLWVTIISHSASTAALIRRFP